MANPVEISGAKRKWLKIMASPAILFYALPWLIFLLIAGTVAQRDMGLYQAQEYFFSSWFLWIGLIPLPGSYLTLGAITACLMAKFLLYSPWRMQQAGIILSHLGVLILLIGGIITAFSQNEGFIVIKEGQSAKAVSDYHQRVLTVRKDNARVTDIPFSKLKPDDMLPLDVPFKVSVESVCSNCRPAPVKNAQSRHGLAEQIVLREAPGEKDSETNLAGVTLSISELDGGQNGVYMTMEEIPHRPSVTKGNAVYDFSMGRAQRPLPFSIELKDFEREMHPGTDMARGFSSSIVVHDGDVAWPYIIRMNEPLRYKGYTFYQASFSVKPDGEYSVLSVVTNKGRVLPYIASAVIFAGLLLHIILRLTSAKRKTC